VQVEERQINKYFIGGQTMQEKLCFVLEEKDRLKLVSPSFTFTLDTATQLKAVSFENRICGKLLDMGNGLEFEADFDSADDRIYIGGWKVNNSEKGNIDPNAEEGFVNGYFRYEFNDSKWDGCQSPNMFEAFRLDSDQFKWARTHIFLSEKHKGHRISVNIGGFGLLDFQYLRIFINGKEVGTRVTKERWHEPACFELDSSSEIYSCLRFGEDNIISLQLTGYVCRNEKLDKFDPLEGREMATIGRSWPGQFEQFLTVGQPLKTPTWYVKDKKVLTEGNTAEAEFLLESDCGNMTALARYKWSSCSPVLHKWVEIKNHSQCSIRLMNLRLGDYRTNLKTTEGEQGFPVYLDGSFFMSVVHPSGWAIGKGNDVLLRQYPGKLLGEGESFSCMETVLGVSCEQQAREAFLCLVESCMRRVKLGHDKAYSIFESFGSWPIRLLEADYGYFPNEEIILDNIGKVAAGQTLDGCHFDYYSIEFWNDYYGDLERPGLERFPHGFDKIKEELNCIGTSLGLWIDTAVGRWNIGGNPSVIHCRTYDFAAYDSDMQCVLLGDGLCRAEDPYRSMFVNGFLHHIRENNVRMLKFDDAMAICHNPKHGHLPGIYSTEAIQSAEISMLQAFDSECPDIFLILYWGHRSPWWLLYGEVLFESGLFLEASTPASFPTLYARDGVTVALDQASYWCEDVPKLGKDSLGVWLSDWAWNSSIKKERWQEGVVMDMCRGSLLFQLWSDHEWLSAEERRQAALFMELLKKGEDCFRNPKLILGNPWNYEPYGYSCSNGERAFISLNNCTWTDTKVQLELNEQWGLAFGKSYDIYRWYPEMAKLMDGAGGFRDTESIVLRPFEVVLLEVVPQGNMPTLNKGFISKPIVKHFDEPARKLELSAERLEEAEALRVPLEDYIFKNSIDSEVANDNVSEWSDVPKRVKEKFNASDYAQHTKQTYRIITDIPQCDRKSILYFAASMKKDGQLLKLFNTGLFFAAEAKFDGDIINYESVIGLLTYAVPWQGWRVLVPESCGRKQFEIKITAKVPEGTEMEFEGYFIPMA
jgi:hypothetical protein